MPESGPKAKKAGDKNKKVVSDETALSSEDEKVFLQRQVDALKLQLERESMKAMQAELQVREHRQRYVDLQAAIQASEEKALTISLDMARQYRSMRDSLQADIDSLKAQLSTAAIDHTQAESLWRAERSEWEAKLAACQALIGSERERNAELTAEFGTMLQSTLDKMGERLEVTNEWEGDEAQAPNVRTFEEFQMAKTR